MPALRQCPDMADFQLNERLTADSIAVTSLELCGVRVMNDSRYCCLLLVPRRAGVEEWHDLEEADVLQLSREIRKVSKTLKSLTAADKINVTAIGNMVRQMHVHVVARRWSRLLQRMRNDVDVGRPDSEL